MFSTRVRIIAVALLLAVAGFGLGHFYGGPVVQMAAASFDRSCNSLPSGAKTSGVSWLCGVQKAQLSSRFVRSSERKKAIVYVHGILGTATDTWRNTEGQTPVYWPELAKADERLDGYDIFVASYYSPQLGAAPNIFQLSAHLLKDLEDHGVLPRTDGTGQYEEIVFVCHSMGNLVVRTAMLIRPGLSERTPLILSLGAPSEGSALADLVQSLTPQFKDLVAIQSNSFLALLNAVWQNRAFDTEIACAYEMRNYPTLGRMIVERKSAIGVCTRAEPKGLAFDHANMVKPNSRTHPSHDWLVGEVIRPRTQKGWELPRWNENEIIIGAKDHMESNIHAAMMALLVRHAAPDLKVTTRYQAGHASRLYNSLKDRSIDLYPEYDGTLLHEYLGEPVWDGTGSGRARIFPSKDINDKLSLDPRTSNLKMLPHLGFHNPYVLVASRTQARRFGLLDGQGRVAISKLTSVPEKRLVVIADQEFQFRRDGWIGLRERYALVQARYSQTEHASIYGRLAAARNDAATLWVGVGFGTDAELHKAGSDLVTFEDDKALFPYYHPAPFVDARLLKKFPNIEAALAPLAGVITAKEMAELIGSVNQLRQQSSLLPVDKQMALMEQAVQAFLVAKGLLPASEAPQVQSTAAASGTANAVPRATRP